MSARNESAELIELMQVLNILKDQPLKAWSSLLQLGDKCLARLGINDVCWKMPGQVKTEISKVDQLVSTIKNRVTQLDPSLKPDSNIFPWVVFGKDTIDIDNRFISVLKCLYGEAEKESNVRELVLAIISYADCSLKEAVRTLRTFYETRNIPMDAFYSLVENAFLVELPLLPRWWKSHDTSQSRMRLFNFSDGLTTFISTKLSMRVFNPMELGIKAFNSDKNIFEVVLIPLEVLLKDIPLEVSLRDSRCPVFHVIHKNTNKWVEELIKNLVEEDDSFIFKKKACIVLPEFSVSENDWRRIQHAWKNDNQCLAVAGSGHISQDEFNNVNRSAVVTRLCSTETSKPKIAHYKRNPFRITQPSKPDKSSLLEKILIGCENGKIKTAIKKKKVVFERLDYKGGMTGFPLILIDSSWGRISILICKDFLETSASAELIPALTQARVDHIFVPAFNLGSNKRFLSMADNLSKNNGIATYFVNGSLDGPEKDEIKDRIVVYLPGIDRQTPTSEKSILRSMNTYGGMIAYIIDAGIARKQLLNAAYR